MGIDDHDGGGLVGARITRRLLVQRALQAGGTAALLTPAGLLAACGDEQSAATTATGAAQAGGTLRFGSTADPGRLGTNYWGVEGFVPGYALFDRLYELSDDARSIVPGLASALPEGGDGRSYTIKLRDGVTFHDGSELTAEDVKYTIERQLAPDNGSDARGTWEVFGFVGARAFQSGKAKGVAGLKVLDPLTIELQLEQPNAALPFWLTMTMAGIVPKAYGQKVGYERFEQEPIGTGPFKLVEYRPRRGVRLARHREYYRDGVPRLDGVDWRMSVDPELSILRIERDEQDMLLEPIPPGKMASARQDQTFQSRTGNDCVWCAICLDNEYTRDLRVRRAIHLAIDKQKLIRQVSGLGDPETHGIFSPLSPYWQEDFPTYPYDPEKAKEMLADAGYPDGFGISLVAAASFPFNIAAKAVQADLTAIGIDVEARIMPQSELGSYWLTPENTGLSVGRWELPYPHGSYIVDGAWVSSSVDAGGGNFSHLRSDEIDALALEGRSTTDVARQIEVYKQIDRITIGEMALWVPLFYPKFASINSDPVRGYEIPAGPSGDTKIFADYALAAA